MTHIEAMKQALESLGELVADPQCGFGPAYEGIKQRQRKAKTTLRQAIEQAEKQEPCGRLVSDPDDGHIFIPRIKGDWSMLGQDLYTHPQPKAAVPTEHKQSDSVEPVALVEGDAWNSSIRFLPEGLDLPIGTLLYTSPQPQKPLTVVEIMHEWSDAKDSLVTFARAIEAAHNIKE